MVTRHAQVIETQRVMLSHRQRTVILIAINKLRIELSEDRIRSLPDSRREQEIDANLLAIEDLREALVPLM